MSPAVRLGLALATLAVFAWALVPRAVVTAREPGLAPERLLAASRAAFDGSRWEEALDPTRALVERFPNQHVFAERLARVYEGLSRHAEAAGAWERVLRLAPTVDDVCPAIGQAYQNAGNLPAALDAFERCRAAEPGNTDFIYHQARAYQRSGRPLAAEDTFREVLAREPDHIDSVVGLANLHLQEREPSEALALVEPLLKRFPDNADALLVAGMSYHRLHRFDAARRAIEHAIILDDTYPDLHIAMGIIEFSGGHLQEARKHFEQVVTLAPSRRPEVQVWLDRTRGPA